MTHTMDEFPEDLVAIPVFTDAIVTAQCKQERARLAALLFQARENLVEDVREEGYLRYPRFEFKIKGCEKTQRRLSVELAVRFANTGGLRFKYVTNPTGMDDAEYAWGSVDERGQSGVLYAVNLVF